jgi:hypothetical protein
MDKQEILEKSRQDNQFGDERQRRIWDDASGFAVRVQYAVILLLGILNIREGRNAYDLLGILFAYHAAYHLYSFWRERDKKWTLMNGVMNTLFAAGWLFCYIRDLWA